MEVAECPDCGKIVEADDVGNCPHPVVDAPRASEQRTAGAQAGYTLCTSGNYAHIDRENIPGYFAARLFLPPIDEAKIEMQRPLPKERAEWIRDFEAAREASRRNAEGE